MEPPVAAAAVAILSAMARLPCWTADQAAVALQDCSVKAVSKDSQGGVGGGGGWGTHPGLAQAAATAVAAGAAHQDEHPGPGSSEVTILEGRSGSRCRHHWQIGAEADHAARSASDARAGPIP